jgi:hypothetical protein
MMPELLEMVKTAVASAGTPMAQYGRQLMSFHLNSCKTCQNWAKIRDERPKKVYKSENPQFSFR